MASWTSVNSGSVEDGMNWVDGDMNNGVPGVGDTCTIYHSMTIAVTPTTFAPGSIDIQPMDGALHVESPATWNYSGAIYIQTGSAGFFVNGGDVTLTGTVSIAGKVFVQAGTLNVTGAGLSVSGNYNSGAAFTCSDGTSHLPAFSGLDGDLSGMADGRTYLEVSGTAVVYCAGITGGAGNSGVMGTAYNGGVGCNLLSGLVIVSGNVVGGIGGEGGYMYPGGNGGHAVYAQGNGQLQVSGTITGGAGGVGGSDVGSGVSSGGTGGNGIHSPLGTTHVSVSSNISGGAGGTGGSGGYSSTGGNGGSGGNGIYAPYIAGITASPTVDIYGGSGGSGGAEGGSYAGGQGGPGGVGIEQLVVTVVFRDLFGGNSGSSNGSTYQSAAGNGGAALNIYGGNGHVFHNATGGTSGAAYGGYGLAVWVGTIVHINGNLSGLNYGPISLPTEITVGADYLYNPTPGYVSISDSTTKTQNYGKLTILGDKFTSISVTGSAKIENKNSTAQFSAYSATVPCQQFSSGSGGMKLRNRL